MAGGRWQVSVAVAVAVVVVAAVVVAVVAVVAVVHSNTHESKPKSNIYYISPLKLRTNTTKTTHWQMKGISCHVCRSLKVLPLSRSERKNLKHRHCSILQIILVTILFHQPQQVMKSQCVFTSTWH